MDEPGVHYILPERKTEKCDMVKLTETESSIVVVKDLGVGEMRRH